MSQREAAGTAGRAGLAEVARGSALNLAGAVISAAATLATTVIVTRHFSRAVAGAFVTATSLFLIVEAIAGLGAGNGAVYFIARLRPASNKGPSPNRSARPAGTSEPPEETAPSPADTANRTGRLDVDGRVAAILRASVRPVLVASVLSAGLMLVFAGPLARLLVGGPLGHGGAAPGPAAGAIRALAVAVPFAALADTFLGASRGFRNMLPTVAVDRIARPAAQVAGLIAAVAVGRAALLAPLWSLPYLPASLAAWLWLRRTRLRPRPAARPAPAPRAARARAAAPAPPAPWAMPAHPSSPPARHWTLSAQPGTRPVTRHGQGWPRAHSDPRAHRPELREVPLALAVLLALSRPVPPPSPVTGPPDDQPGAPAGPVIPPALGWATPVPPPRSGSGSSWGPAPRVPGRPGDPAK